MKILAKTVPYSTSFQVATIVSYTEGRNEELTKESHLHQVRRDSQGRPVKNLKRQKVVLKKRDHIISAC